MKLYEAPRQTKVRTESGAVFHFDHIDGMYSYCFDEQGNVVHLFAGTEVELVTEET